MENQVATQEKTNKLTGFCYSFGEVGSQLSWYMINTYLTVFYTDIVGLSASAISLIMLIARVWDAINDPMMGVIADRTRTRWGKFRPYLMFASPFLAIFNVLTFTVFPVQGLAKVILCLVCYIGAGMAYTAICVTYGGLVNLIARDSQVRMNYTAYRATGASVIKMILSAGAMPLILFFSKSDAANAQGYFWATIVFSVLMLPCFWICAARCKETVVVEAPQQTVKKRSVLESLKLMCKNKMLLITVSNVFLGALAIMCRMSMLTYYVIYVVGSFTMIAPIFYDHDSNRITRMSGTSVGNKDIWKEKLAADPQRNHGIRICDDVYRTGKQQCIPAYDQCDHWIWKLCCKCQHRYAFRLYRIWRLEIRNP